MYLVKQLWKNNTNISKVYIIIGEFFGTVKNLPFTKCALRNLSGQINCDEADNDVREIIEVFDEIAA